METPTYATEMHLPNLTLSSRFIMARSEYLTPMTMQSKPIAMSVIAFGLNYGQQVFTNHGAAIRRIPMLIIGV
jgi:hypothetical protein